MINSKVIRVCCCAKIVVTGVLVVFSGALLLYIHTGRAVSRGS